ncbi:MAG TPA: hypothetical protein PKK40_03010, partial [Marmoricola sp.]|nr:hypothetical protein [Marmoricola sp.]
MTSSVVADLRATFHSGRTRSYEWRMAQLDGLDRLFQEQGKALEQALWADLRKSATEAQITETGSTYAELALARKSLKKWMKPRKLSLPMQIKPASADLV